MPEYLLLICRKGKLKMYDIVWDDVFEQFYVPSNKEIPDLTGDELEMIEARADLRLMDAAGIL